MGATYLYNQPDSSVPPRPPRLIVNFDNKDGYSNHDHDMYDIERRKMATPDATSVTTSRPGTPLNMRRPTNMARLDD